LTLTPEKFPFPSAVADPTTLFGVSQNSDICSPARNEFPLTVIWVVAPPALTSSVT
jgi:hypothetical protein